MITKEQNYVNAANYFGRNGSIIRDPKIIIKFDNTEYGDFNLKPVHVVIEWATMNWRGIVFGEVKRYCEKHNPAIYVKINGREDWIKFNYLDTIEEINDKIVKYRDKS